MKKVDPEKIQVKFVCDMCCETTTEKLSNLPYYGAPCCTNEDCDELHTEMSMDEVFLED